jgi:hypothetical protein
MLLGDKRLSDSFFSKLVVYCVELKILLLRNMNPRIYSQDLVSKLEPIFQSEERGCCCKNYM